MDKQSAECFEFASKFSIIILNQRDLLLSCSESLAESFPNELRAEGENMKSPFKFSCNLRDKTQSASVTIGRDDFHFSVRFSRDGRVQIKKKRKNRMSLEMRKMYS